MDWAALIPALISLLQNLVNNFKAPSPPAPGPGSTQPGADQAIKDLQTFLNSALALNPPLAVDGWLGPKTDAAIEQGLAMLRSVNYPPRAQ